MSNNNNNNNNNPSDNNNNNNNNNKSPATPDGKNSQQDDSWKGLVDNSVFNAMNFTLIKAVLLRTKWECILGSLRSNPQSSRSQSYSEYSDLTEPSPTKKAKVDDAEGLTANDAVQPLQPDWKGEKEEEAVKNVVEKWKELLSPRKEKHDSQDTFEDSQYSATSVSESVSSSYAKQDNKLRFKTDCTHDKQLEFLKLRRSEGKVTKKLQKEAANLCVDWQKTPDRKKAPLSATFEECLTQPFVNSLISAALPHLQSYAKPKLKQVATELQYYCETQHSAQAGLSRLPDGLLYITGEGSDDPKLTEEAQRIGALMSVECKTDLQPNKPLCEALREVERDAAEKAKLENILQPETMCGLTSDGVSWQFHFFSWEVDAFLPDINFKRESSTIFFLENDLEMIAEWLVFSLMRSLKTHKKIGLKVDIPVGKATMTKVFVSNPKRLRPQVFKASEKDRDLVIKFFGINKGQIKDAVHQELADRLMMERKYLEDLHDVPSFVSLARSPANDDQSEDNLFEKYVLCMEDAGTALNSVIISGHAGKHLAKIVYKDILQGALPALNLRKLCFADIHPGNICVKGGSARLVDLESIKQLGESLDKSPILLRENAPQSAEVQWDEASVAAILCCLWDDGNFDNLKDYAGRFMDSKKRAEFITRLEGDLTGNLHPS